MKQFYYFFCASNTIQWVTLCKMLFSSIIGFYS
ncbi:hypothetical protein CFU_1469 [Collimonas fungivorans Ter331]|uniref:Uncharacterized protein n=1 Tax=Collimonas fungivorans (strain Ter331) TaxID=1005048 RepID=G0AB95_COLFT|nr:hypothetical protein CFU_1469 [Collimonas fungivorans Ter331]